MKSILLSFTALLFITAGAYAQPGGAKERKERIEAARIAFITQEVGLTPDEAKAFWPVYNNYQEELETVRKKRRKALKAAREGGLDSKTDQEVEAMLDQEIAFRKQEIAIEEKYHAELKKVLPVKKLAKLYMAEEKFKRVMLKRLKEESRPDASPRKNK